jgi:hypothetical protein
LTADEDQQQAFKAFFDAGCSDVFNDGKIDGPTSSGKAPLWSELMVSADGPRANLSKCFDICAGQVAVSADVCAATFSETRGACVCAKVQVFEDEVC